MTIRDDRANPTEIEAVASAAAEPLETLVEAITRLRDDGYATDLFATPSGSLVCHACGTSHDPEALEIRETVRFEGDSNPDDEAILLAVCSADGCLAQYSAAFGPTTAAADVMALQRFLPGGLAAPGSVPRPVPAVPAEPGELAGKG